MAEASVHGRFDHFYLQAVGPDPTYFLMINILGTVGPFLVMIAVGIAEYLKKKRAKVPGPSH